MRFAEELSTGKGVVLVEDGGKVAWQNKQVAWKQNQVLMHSAWKRSPRQYATLLTVRELRRRRRGHQTRKVHEDGPYKLTGMVKMGITCVYPTRTQS